MTFSSNVALSSNAVTPPDVPTQARPARVLTVLIAAPTIESGAPDEGAVDLATMLAGAGHRAIVVSGGGRLESRLARAGAEFIRLDMASRNPFVIARQARALFRLVRHRGCDVVHAHGRACAWSAGAAARLAGVPFLTSWYKGFGDQNTFKRLYNSIMARGDRVITPSRQIADLIVARYRAARERIAVIPSAVDFDRFDPTALTIERINAVRSVWGVTPDTKVILVAGRMSRRKGHHVAVQAARRLKDMGLTDFLLVFAGEDQGRGRYSGELWDLVLATGTADVVRMAWTPADMPAAYGAAACLLSAAVQPEGLQRTILESLAMSRPLVVSDLAAGPDIVLAPPSVPEERMTGLRFAAGDDAALAATLMRLFAMPDAARRAMGRRGREWVVAHCDRESVTGRTLAVYAEVTGPLGVPATARPTDQATPQATQKRA
ncbi:MAG TPA: glycosyltransferase [Xanthobacteraceae bacterium]